MKKTLATLILFLCMSSVYGQETKLKGNWQGHIDVQGQQLVIKTHFTGDDSLHGTIDIPQQGGRDIPLQGITAKAPDSVFFKFQAGPGLAKFKGAFRGDSAIAGTFHQRGMQFPFEMNRYQPKTDTSDKKINKESKPYNHTDLIIENDSVNIGGTLTWPKKTTAKHLVIMISGSGAQDRDATLTPISDFKPFAVLADSLTMDNIATFRYDDRGVGESSGNFGATTLDMLASDVDAIIEKLTAMPEHNFSEVVILGHSQGGIVAGKVAQENTNVDRVILMASTGVPLKKVLRFQTKQAFAAAGIDSALVSQEITAREQLMETIRNEKLLQGAQEVEQARQTYQKQFKAIQIAAGADSAQAQNLAEHQTKQLEATFRSPQIQSLLFYNPADDLRQLDIPVLVLFGGKDTQVTIDMNKEPIKKALDSADVPYQIWEFDMANHLFQKAQTGSAQEYGSLKKEFVYPFTSRIRRPRLGSSTMRSISPSRAP